MLDSHHDSIAVLEAHEISRPKIDVLVKNPQTDVKVLIFIYLPCTVQVH